MKKIFVLLLLPVISPAQKNYLRNDSSHKHIQPDTINISFSKRDTIMSVIKEGWINVEWLNKIVPVIYLKIEDMYRWDCEWNRAMKGITTFY
jgi:hypothetical protein